VVGRPTATPLRDPADDLDFFTDPADELDFFPEPAPEPDFFTDPAAELDFFTDPAAELDFFADPAAEPDFLARLPPADEEDLGSFLTTRDAVDEDDLASVFALLALEPEPKADLDGEAARLVTAFLAAFFAAGLAGAACLAAAVEAAFLVTAFEAAFLAGAFLPFFAGFFVTPVGLADLATLPLALAGARFFAVSALAAGAAAAVVFFVASASRMREDLRVPVAGFLGAMLGRSFPILFQRQYDYLTRVLEMSSGGAGDDKSRDHERRAGELT